MAFFASQKRDKWPRFFLFSTTGDLNNISYIAYVYNWENKEDLYKNNRERWDNVSRAIKTFMEYEYEDGLYLHGGDSDKICKNLIAVTHMTKLSTPIPITDLIKVSDSKPHGERSTAGGWSEIALTSNQIQLIESVLPPN
jgi:hypothetical protein